jgi:hypothetical protein
MSTLGRYVALKSLSKRRLTLDESNLPPFQPEKEPPTNPEDHAEYDRKVGPTLLARVKEGKEKEVTQSKQRRMSM